MLQKGFTEDFLTKKQSLNKGELPKYKIKNSHHGIVSPEVFDLAQHELKKRKSAKGYNTGGSPFSSKIVCGECGSYYGSKVWHSTSKYRRSIWQCNHKFKNDEKCSTPHIYEDTLKQAFVEAFNGLVENKTEIIKNYETIIQTLTDTTEFDGEIAKLQSESDLVFELLRKCVEENSCNAIDQEEYNKRYSALVERYETAKANLEKINDKKLERTAKSESITAFMQVLALQEGVITEFDEGLWNAMVDIAMVEVEGGVVFRFRDEMEVG